MHEVTISINRLTFVKGVKCLQCNVNKSKLWYIDWVWLKPPPKNSQQNYLTFLHKFPTTIWVTIPEQKFLVLPQGKNDTYAKCKTHILGDVGNSAQGMVTFGDSG